MKTSAERGARSAEQDGREAHAAPPGPDASRPSPPRIGGPGGRTRVLPLLHWLPYLLIALVVAVTLAHHLPRVLSFQAAMLRYPFPTHGSEGLIVHEAGRLARGQSIYVANPPDAHGFVSGPYTPLYFLAVAATLKLTPTIFAGGRAITFVAWLALLALLGALAWSSAGRGPGTRSRVESAEPRTGSRPRGRNAAVVPPPQDWGGRGGPLRAPRLARLLGAATAVSLLAVFSPGVIWAVRVKPTIPALALAAAGLLIVQQWHAAPGHRYLWAVAPFLAAYLTKQTTLAAPLAATLFLAVHAGRRAALRFAGLGALGGAALFVALDLATRHQFFERTVADRRLPWRGQLLLNFGALYLRDYWPLLAAAVIAAGLLVLARARSVAPYYLLAALLLVPTIGVVGADHDHLIELALACSLALGAAVAHLASQPPAPSPFAVRPSPLATYPLAALLLIQLATAWTPDRWYAGELTVPGPRVREQLSLIVNNLRHTPGEALAEDIGLLLLADKPIPYDDPQAMAELARTGRWDQRQLLDDLAQQRFSLVILPPSTRDELWTTETLAAIEANYYLKFRDVWFTYEANRLRPPR